MLAVVAVATAWCGYQAALWTGQQAVLYGRGEAAGAEGGPANAANQEALVWRPRWFSG